VEVQITIPEAGVDLDREADIDRRPQQEPQQRR